MGRRTKFPPFPIKPTSRQRRLACQFIIIKHFFAESRNVSKYSQNLRGAPAGHERRSGVHEDGPQGATPCFSVSFSLVSACL